MKKGFIIGLSVVLTILFFLIIREGEDIGRNFQFRGNSFMEGIQIVQKENGETLWTLNAKRADFLEGEEKAELTDMSMVMPKNNIVIYTERGVYNLSDKRFMTDCPVKARSKDFLITADSIDYDVSTGNIMSDGRVELDSEKMRIEGKGLKTANGKTITIYDDVKATFYQ
jgi:hypothetical protein